MKLQLFLWVLVLISGMGPNLEAAEIYQWIDKDGVQHFTDGPPPPGAQIVDGLSDTPSDEPPSTSGPKNRKDTNPVERDENDPTDPGDTGAVEGGENAPTDREDYWRRLGWGNDTKDREDTGAAEGGENGPPDRDDPGAAEGRENGSTERKTN